jgi:superfamily I DNA/RNA helicase
MISLIDAGPGTGKTYALTYSYLKLKQKLVGNITPTEEQQAIFDYVTSEFSPNSSVCFFAHNNSTKDTLTKRLGKNGPKIQTFHGAGLSVLIKRFGYQKLVNNRTEKHIQLITGQSTQDMSWDEKKIWYAIKRICHYIKIESLEPDEETLHYLLLKYPDLCTYSIPDDWQENAEKLLDYAGRPDGEVEFADMVWFGKKVITKPKFTLGLVDESQDVSNSTYQLVTRLCEHVLFCGDKNQAINAFAGASEEMYKNIADKADAILPLKKTQRCPPHICKLANKVRPGGILEGPNQEEGLEKEIYLSSLPEMLKGVYNPTNCLFIARTNAAVVGTALFFHKHNIPFQIIDKDLATEINNFIKSFKVSSIKELKKRLTLWIEKARNSKNPMWVHMCEDKFTYTNKIIDECTDYKDIFKLVKDAFEKHPLGFKVTTVHKSKGLEAKNIFVINPPIPLALAMEHPIQREQEYNLMFVGLTRSALNLFWVK